jgi:hypothetical protein
MFSKDKALKIAIITLSIIAGVDLIRGFMHTFNIWWASENIAHMSQTADTMFLMNTFGVSNLLTGFIYILVIKKAKDIAPHILLLIPGAYLLGTISNHMTGVKAMQSATEWNGQYVMYVYLFAIGVIGLNYFIASYREDKTQLVN